MKTLRSIVKEAFFFIFHVSPEDELTRSLYLSLVGAALILFGAFLTFGPQNRTIGFVVSGAGAFLVLRDWIRFRRRKPRPIDLSRYHD